MADVTVTMVRCEDWEGLYFDDELINEGHNINLENAIADIIEKAKGHEIVDFATYWVDNEELEGLTPLPKSLKALDSMIEGGLLLQ